MSRYQEHNHGGADVSECLACLTEEDAAVTTTYLVQYFAGGTWETYVIGGTFTDEREASAYLAALRKDPSPAVDSDGPLPLRLVRRVEEVLA